MSNIITKEDRQAQVLALKDALNNPGGNLAKLLPKGWDLDRYAAMCMGAIQREPKLLDCNRTELLGAFNLCASMGWSLDPSLGHAFINPREITVKRVDKDGVEVVGKKLVPVLQPQYRGLQTVVCRNKDVRAVVVHLVYERDEFEMDLADPLRPVKTHKPPKTGPRGPVIGGWAGIVGKDGALNYFEWMSIDDLEQVRNMDVSKSSAWKSQHSTVVDEMYRKTLIRRVCKHGDMQDPSISRALELVGQAEAGVPQNLGKDEDPEVEWEVADSMADKTEEAGQAGADKASQAAAEMSPGFQAPEKLSPAQAAALQDTIDVAIRPYYETAAQRKKASDRVMQLLVDAFGDPLPPAKLAEMRDWVRAFVKEQFGQKDAGGEA